ncbi:MAG TPA: glutamate-1-semialdehyde 2,1-aminomutase [Candidatus Dormibacteraeota bacterium]|nr:glutamate-1-semialdehyde 2,1-aminomutase [Candidatus Dormibacteraeota bacterium]
MGRYHLGAGVLAVSKPVNRRPRAVAELSPDQSAERAAAARRVIPGGVNSPVRAYQAVGGDPVFIERGEGAYVIDPDGKRYIDLVGAYGPLILGHAHPEVVAALQRQAAAGSSFGAPTEAETRLAELVVDNMPSVEMVRLVNSGTEATMSAIRVARAATERDLVVKFSGGYHGHADHLLAEAGSGVATMAVPGSPGVPAAFTDLTVVLPYNDVASVEAIFSARGSQVAAVIVEPVAGNMGVVEGSDAFLGALRRLSEAHGTVLIFDEVMSGFRLGLGGAEERIRIRPDLTCLGKVIGGGLPLAAYGGSARLMRLVAPMGPVYQAGTLSGNPMATAAGLATLGQLVVDPPYVRLDEAGARVQAALEESARLSGLRLTVNRAGSMLTPFFTVGPVVDYASARAADVEAYARLFHALLDRGVLVPPSQFEAWFLSTAVAGSAMDGLLSAVRAAMSSLSTV